MSDLLIRQDGRAGRITLNRPKALNAVTWDMVREIHQALRDWADNDAVALVIIDAAGDRAFAAGGDIVDLYNASRGGDLNYGRTFWAEEYRLNLYMAEFPKPLVSMMHGFTMGGGVGVSCHCSHRIVDESVQIAMPECGIGLIPDVGGSWLLARTPQGLGPFIGVTGYRMGPGDAIFAGFADHFVPRERWAALIANLCECGDVAVIDHVKIEAPDMPLDSLGPAAKIFGAPTLNGVLERLDASDHPDAAGWRKALEKQSPLAAAAAIATIDAAAGMTLKEAFAQEYRFVWRAVEKSDFLEGIRAQVIEKDRSPKWRHGLHTVSTKEVDAMLAPLGADEWTSSPEAG